MKKIKEQTSTSIVEEYMRVHDDFITAAALKTALGMDDNHVSASLHHLRKAHVVDCMQEVDALWWYPLPKECDTRTKVLKERTPESKPRRPRRMKKGIV